MPKPMGRVMRDEQNRIIDTRTLIFHEKYDLSAMTEEELTALTEALIADSKELRRRKGRDKEFPKKLYLARLRQTQAKAVRAILREKQEQEI